MWSKIKNQDYYGYLNDKGENNWFLTYKAAFETRVE